MRAGGDSAAGRMTGGEFSETADFDARILSERRNGRHPAAGFCISYVSQVTEAIRRSLLSLDAGVLIRPGLRCEPPLPAVRPKAYAVNLKISK